MNLDELLALPKSGVVILIMGNQVLVSYTESMGANLESIYNQFKGRGSTTPIVLRVASAGADLETLKLHTEYYRDYYSKKGMLQPMVQLRASIRYRVRAVPRPDYKGVDVEVVSARGEGKVVGRFKNSAEAKDFIETYYGTDNPFCLPVYGSNSATKEFLKEKQTKLLDIK
jgi:hypothetical protein